VGARQKSQVGLTLKPSQRNVQDVKTTGKKKLGSQQGTLPSLFWVKALKGPRGGGKTASTHVLLPWWGGFWGSHKAESPLPPIRDQGLSCPFDRGERCSLGDLGNSRQRSTVPCESNQPNCIRSARRGEGKVKVRYLDLFRSRLRNHTEVEENHI